MYFITEKNTETGKKFQKIVEKRAVAMKEVKALAEKYNIYQWRSENGFAWGGMSSCIFSQAPDTKIWGKSHIKGEFFPKKSTRAGKSVLKEIDLLTKVSDHELNMCVNFNGAPFKTIGFVFGNDDYFGFIVKNEWDFKKPEDCKEVTYSEYKELFNIK